MGSDGKIRMARGVPERKRSPIGRLARVLRCVSIRQGRNAWGGTVAADGDMAKAILYLLLIDRMIENR